MKRKTIYLMFGVLGLVLPYWQFVPWVMANHGIPIGLFLKELLANRISGFFGMDVLVSAVVLILFVRYEGKRLRMRHLWLPVAGTFAVGVSLGFPLFLYLREGAMEQAARATSDSAPESA